MVPLAIFLTLIAIFSRAILNAWYYITRKPADDLKGKVAIVTGSSRGIGRTIAKHLAQAGAKVMLNGRNEELLRREKQILLDAGFDVDACRADVTEVSECQKLVDRTLDRFGQIDILINNAGVGTRGLFEDTDEEVFRKQLKVNLFGSLNPTLVALPHLKLRKGHVVYISTLAGLRGLPNSSPYSMSKMMITSLAETLRRELKGTEVHTGIVHVGITKNDSGKKVMHGNGTYMPLAERPSIVTDSQDYVARAVVRNIKHRRFRTIVGIKGLIFQVILRFVPGLMEGVLRIGSSPLLRKSRSETPAETSPGYHSLSAGAFDGVPRYPGGMINSFLPDKPGQRSFAGRVAIISGAVSSNSKAIAQLLAQRGATVIMTDRNKAALHSSAAVLGAKGYPVSSFSSNISTGAGAHCLVDHVMKTYGRIDLLIVGDTLEKRGYLDLRNIEVYREMILSNVLGTVNVVKASLPFLKKSSGSVLFISTVAGFKCMPGTCPSSMTQLAKKSLAESLRTELYSDGVNVGLLYIRDEHSEDYSEWSYNEKFDKNLNTPAAIAEEVALVACRALEYKRFKTAVGSRMRFYCSVQRFAPWLMDLVIEQSRSNGINNTAWQGYSLTLNNEL